MGLIRFSYLRAHIVSFFFFFFHFFFFADFFLLASYLIFISLFVTGKIYPESDVPTFSFCPKAWVGSSREQWFYKNLICLTDLKAIYYFYHISLLEEAVWEPPYFTTQCDGSRAPKGPFPQICTHASLALNDKMQHYFKLDKLIRPILSNNLVL